MRVFDQIFKPLIDEINEYENKQDALVHILNIMSRFTTSINASKKDTSSIVEDFMDFQQANNLDPDVVTFITDVMGELDYFSSESMQVFDHVAKTNNANVLMIHIQSKLTEIMAKQFDSLSTLFYKHIKHNEDRLRQLQFQSSFKDIQVKALISKLKDYE